MSRYGAIDCGTNALRLLVADVIDGELREISREMRTVRLGEGVDATGEFTPAALERTFAALDEYARMIDGLDVSALRVVATSASRDVRNADEMIGGFQRRARGSARGHRWARRSPTLVRGRGARATGWRVSDFPVLVADIGGGSTEFIRGSGPRVDLIEACTSIDVGCVRMTERCLHSDPPTDDEIRDATGDCGRRTRSSLPRCLGGFDSGLHRSRRVGDDRGRYRARPHVLRRAADPRLGDHPRPGRGGHGFPAEDEPDPAGGSARDASGDGSTSSGAGPWSCGRSWAGCPCPASSPAKPTSWMASFTVWRRNQPPIVVKSPTIFLCNRLCPAP